MKDVLLGRASEIPKEYDPSILTSLSRLDSRIKSGLGEHSSILQGRDFWTSYEASWLNFQGIPQNKILNISYNSNSKFFVESKSLKLYLFSLNNKKFNFKSDGDLDRRWLPFSLTVAKDFDSKIESLSIVFVGDLIVYKNNEKVYEGKSYLKSKIRKN